MKTLMVLKMKFGAGGPGEDSFGLRMYGFFPDKLGSDINISMVNEDESMSGSAFSDSQLVTFWFQFRALIPYGRISGISKKILDSLESRGYTKVRSSINNLVDTTHQSYNNRPESKFPLEPNTGGYNAADGISIVVAKSGSGNSYTLKEINEIRHMAVEFSNMAYGKKLREIN